MAALPPLTLESTTGTPAPAGAIPASSPAPPINPPAQVQRPQLVVIDGRLVVAGSNEAAQAAASPLSKSQTTDATPSVDTPDSSKSLAQAIASENGPSAAPPPPTRAELEAQLAQVAAQVADTSPGAPESNALELKEAQIEQALSELTIAPSSYGAFRPNLRGFGADKVA